MTGFKRFDRDGGACSQSATWIRAFHMQILTNNKFECRFSSTCVISHKREVNDRCLDNKITWKKTCWWNYSIAIETEWTWTAIWQWFSFYVFFRYQQMAAICNFGSAALNVFTMTWLKIQSVLWNTRQLLELIRVLMSTSKTRKAPLSTGKRRKTTIYTNSLPQRMEPTPFASVMYLNSPSAKTLFTSILWKATRMPWATKG